MERKQKFKDSYCINCNHIHKFVSTLNPEGYWVCSNCRFRVSKLVDKPEEKKWI